MKWSGQYRVLANDIDCNQVVSATKILQFMQDAAFSQMEDNSPSYDDLFRQGLAFILSKMQLLIHAPLYSHDRITVESWACPSKGLIFQRCYRILRGEQVIAEAISAWALAGVHDRKLHRVTEVELHYGTEEPLTLDVPARIRIPADLEMKLVGEHTVQYADIDQNIHMNNTVYADMLCSCIPMENMRVSSLHINYQTEAPLGETIRIYHGCAGGVHYFRTLCGNDSVNIEAEMVVEKIK
ncbi:MAG: hypothetical protein IJ325_07715 [Clostridia bacterium]|nr:hypothetical protein [Clostridia bacterium]